MTIKPQTHQSLISVLTWGFRLALLLLLAGVTVAAIRGDGLTRNVEPIRSVPAGIWHGRSAALVDAGFVVLLVTPAIGVAAVLTEFIRQRNGRLIIATAVVFGTLGVGFLLAFR